MANVYVDFSATFDGDGTAANQAASGGAVGAFNTLTSVTDTASNKVWIRRTGTGAWTSNFSYTAASLEFIGWPSSGDEDYSTRPASGTSNGWDADSNTYAQIDTTTGNVYFSLSGNSQKFKRIRLRQQASFTFNPALYVGLSNSGTGIQVTNCRIETNYSSAPSVLAVQGQNALLDSVVVVTSLSGGSAIDCSSSNSNGVVLKNCQVIEGASSAGIGIKFTKSGIAKDCSVTLTGAGATGIYPLFSSTGNYIAKIQDCTIDVAAGFGFNGDTFLYQNTVEIRNTTVNAKKMAFGSTLSPSSIAFTQSVANTGSYGIQIFAGELTLENATFIAGNSYDLDIYEGALILLRNCTLQSTPPYNVARRLNPGLFVGDINGNLGFFKSYNESGTVETSSTARTGGRGFSLKLTPNNDIFSMPLLRVGLEGMETIMVPLAVGSRTLTVYGAHKLWSTAPVDDEIYFECDYVSSGSGATRTVATSKGIGSALTSDTSVWTGDTGLTLFKMTVTFSAAQACVAPIRMYLAKADGSAYIYLDPLVEVA